MASTKKMNDMSEWKHDIRSLVRRFEQAVNSGYMMNMDDEETCLIITSRFRIYRRRRW